MKPEASIFNYDPTYLGAVMGVSSSVISVQLSKSIASGLSIIKGKAYRIGQVGSFIRIPQGYQDLFGIVSEIGAKAVPIEIDAINEETGRWIQVQLVGESMGGFFERGISQYPNIGDSVHLVTEDTLSRIYGSDGFGEVKIGSLSSAESIPAKLTLNELVTRHSAILGSTGSGKSTTVASLLRSICAGSEYKYQSARILMLDIHGEYSEALADLANIYSVDPRKNEKKLLVPYWALDSNDLLGFLTGGVEDTKKTAFTDKIFNLKIKSHEQNQYDGLDESSITIDTPIPFSLKKLWYDLIDFEIMTFEGNDRDEPAKLSDGNVENLTPPKYKPHAMGSKGPFLNSEAPGIRKQLNLLRSKMVDKRYDFLLHPGSWEPDIHGTTVSDLDELLKGWLGGNHPITVLDLSGVPSSVLEILIGSILKIIYDSLFWSREKSEGGVERPLLIVMEEAHRYLSMKKSTLALEMAKTIAKEGRKYGVGAMVISQRPSEVDETILSQCGTFFALRLSNQSDRDRVKGTLPDGLLSLLDVLPVLRTGEAVVMGEAAKMPMRCRMTLPAEEQRPKSTDPAVADKWANKLRQESYARVVASWRAQNPRAVIENLDINREPIEDQSGETLIKPQDELQ